jgi:MPBQ/MSBQ methyltransferase
MSESIKVPGYFDALLDAFDPLHSSRFVHLGHWDNPAEVQHDDFPVAQERLNDILLQMAALNNGLSVADIGCGLGGSLERINQRFSGMNLTGVNIDDRQLAVCRQLVAENHNSISWQQADALALPFPDHSIDRLLCIEAMFHFRSRTQFFSEVVRVLKPSGIFVASDIVVTEGIEKLNAPTFLSEAVLQHAFGPWPDLQMREGTHQQLASQCGLKELACIDASAETLPSHRFTTPKNIDWENDPGNPAIQAALTLRWLHENGYLKYVYMCFEK